MNNVIEKLMSKYPNKTIFTSKEIKAAAVEIGENPRSAYTAVKYTNNCPSPHRGSYNLERMMPKSSIPSKYTTQDKMVEELGLFINIPYL